MKSRIKFQFFLLSVFSVLFLQTTLAQDTQLEVEPNHSTFAFSVDIADGFSKVLGRFKEYRIDIDYREKDLTKSSVKVEIQAKSIDTGIDGRDEHLRTTDFFAVDSFPLITFVSSEIIEISKNNYLASGDFTMHGITKTIHIPFEKVKEEANTLGFIVKTKINRIDFGVGTGFKHDAIDNFLSEEIDVEVFFWTRKKKQK